MGLGEVERRYALKELSKADAIALVRTVAREKGVEALVRLPDDTLYNYAQKMSSYPLAIKWVVGQVALGKDLDRLIESLVSTSGDIARFCFEHIYDNLLSENARMVLCCLAASDTPLTRGVLTHVSGLQAEQLDKALRDLTLASLIIQGHEESADHTIVTKYSLLPLTLGYLRTKIQSQPETLRTIKARMELVSSRMEEATRAGKQYRYALQDLGATTDEERIAASWALTAYQRSQIGDYNGAVEAFKRAVEIAPNFSRIYRNWATVESVEGHHDSATELMEKATSLTPDDPTLWFVWGNIEKRRGWLERSRRYFQRALTLSPNDGAVLGGLGEVEKRSGNYQEADQYFQQALSVPLELRSYKHEVITHTAIADNLRRWSQELWKDKQVDAALYKAKDAYDHATYAVQMTGSDTRARDTLQETAFQLAMMLLETEDVESALPFFQEAIVTNPRRAKDKKKTAHACYHASRGLMRAGRLNEAKHYYQIGERARPRTEEERQRFEALRAELFDHRPTGRISYVPRNAAYGFIERDDAPGQTVFAHKAHFVPPVSSMGLANMIGVRVSFTIEQTKDGPQARNIKLLES